MITRSRLANNILEKSVIDFVIISVDLLPFVKGMKIDEKRENALTRLRKEKGYKGNLYCSRECFYDFQSRNKWWESSPTREIMKEKQVSMPEAVEILHNTRD